MTTAPAPGPVEPAIAATDELPETPRQSMEIAVVQMAATWVVQRALASAYRRITGNAEPTARDADVPLGRIFVWAATTAAAVAIVNVAVDRWVLRPRGAGVGPLPEFP